MRIWATACSLIAMSLLLAAVRGAEPATGDPLADAVAPFLEEQTVLVAHLNLAAFDLAGTINWLAELTEMPDQDRDRLRAEVAMAGIVTQAFRSEKPIDVYLVVSLADMGRLPFSWSCRLTSILRPRRSRARRASNSPEHGIVAW